MPKVEIQTESGRTTNSITTRNSSVFHVSARPITSGVRFAVRMTNTPDTSRTAMSSLNLRSSFRPARRELASVMPYAVTATRPISFSIISAMA